MPDRPFTETQKWWLVGLSAIAVVLLLIVVVVVQDDDSDVAVDETTTTSQTSTTTSTTSTSTTTAPPFTPDVDQFAVAYPSPQSSQRFESPQAAAQSYATQVLGFTELVVSDLREGDSRSGEVPITDRDGGPETVVLVRKMADDTWFVLGSQTADIAVDTPDAGDAVNSPFATTGKALAFEGTVAVAVRTQDDPALLGEGFVTGSGVPPAGPFEGSIGFEPPTEETAGIVIFRTYSAEDGHVQQATSFPVKLLP